jgi:hypothetical protein
MKKKEGQAQKSFCVDCWKELKRREVDNKTYEVYCPEHGVKYRCKDYAKGDL